MPFVPWFLLQDSRCQPQTACHGPCPACGWQEAGKQEEAFGCFKVLSAAATAASQSNRRVQTWKRLSSLHPCWCFGWVRSVILNLLSWSSLLVLLWCLAWLSGGVDSSQREGNWGMQRRTSHALLLLGALLTVGWTTASPKSSKCAGWRSGPQHQLFCCTAYQCRNSLQV